MVAQHTIHLRAESFDRPTARMVEEMRTEFDGDAIECLECVAKQHQFAFRIQGAALDPFTVPGRTNLNPLRRMVDIHIGGHADGLPGCVLDNSERQHRAGRLETAPTVDFGTHLIGGRHARIPKLQTLAVMDSLDQIVVLRNIMRPQDGNNSS